MINIIGLNIFVKYKVMNKLVMAPCVIIYMNFFAKED